MIKVHCDTCSTVIDRDAGGWFGADYQPPPTPVEPDDDGLILLAELHELGVDHEFHFCSPACLRAWSFAREYEPSEGTTT